MTTTTTVESLLYTQSHQIGPDIYETTLNTSPWLKLVKQGKWPDGMGETISMLTVERVIPTTAMKWSDVAFNTGSANNCNPSASTIGFAQSIKTYKLQQAALESERICVNDVRMSFQFRRQLELMFNKLAENTAWAWIQRHRNEYLRLCKNKISAGDTSTWGTDLTGETDEDVGDWFTQVPTSKLTMGLLKKIYMRLIRESAGRSAYGMDNGRPVFALITSAETSDNVLLQDSDRRNDWRNSTRVDELLQPLGVERGYNGFFHLIDDLPPRATYADGKFSLVEPYELAALDSTEGKGSRADLNPDYENAEYEISFVFNPEVYECMIPAPLTSPGGNTEFDPQTYRGDWKWLNIQSETTNPDKSWGYFRGLFTCGSMPNRTEWGYAILHQRCDIDSDYAPCTAASSSAVV